MPSCFLEGHVVLRCHFLFALCRHETTWKKELGWNEFRFGVLRFNTCRTLLESLGAGNDCRTDNYQYQHRKQNREASLNKGVANNGINLFGALGRSELGETLSCCFLLFCMVGPVTNRSVGAENLLPRSGHCHDEIPHQWNSWNPYPLVHSLLDNNHKHQSECHCSK